MRASTKRLISIFIALALIGGAAIFIFNVNAPLWRRVQAVRTEVGEKEGVRNQLADLVSKTQELLARFDDLDRQARPIEAALPPKPNLPEVLAIMGSLASKNNLVLGQVNFEELISRLLTAEPQARPKAMPIKISATMIGEYPDFKNWLKEIETELRLMDAEEIGVQVLAGKANISSFTFSVKLVVYWQPKPEFIIKPTSEETPVEDIVQ